MLWADDADDADADADADDDDDDDDGGGGGGGAELLNCGRRSQTASRSPSELTL